jgi:lipoic acid synthetase
MRSSPSSASLLPAVHLPLGRVEYGEVLALQRSLHGARVRGEIPDTVLTVEHDPVVTIGRSGSEEELLVSEEALRAEGISLFRVERGGRITYHGPGQLVSYPIVDLRTLGGDVKGYVRTLEQAVIDLLGECGVGAARREGFPGVWVGTRKIASVGVAVRRWVTFHGLALNVRVNPRHFGMIRPCGLPIEVVSLDDLVPESHALDLLGERLVGHLAAAFHWRVRVGDPAAAWEGAR